MRHLSKVQRDCFSLASFFGVDAGKGAGGVDQRDNRQTEAISERHQPHRLTIALRPGHAEIMAKPRFRIETLLLTHHANGAAAESSEAAHDGLVVGELQSAQAVGPARVVPEVRRCERHIHVTRFANRLPGVKRLRHGELSAALLQDSADAIEVLRSLAGFEPRPDLPMRTIGRGDGAIGIGSAPLRDFGQRLLRGRVVGDHRLAVRRRPLFTVDEEAVARPNQGELSRLWRRRVGPRAGCCECRRDMLAALGSAAGDDA